MDRSNFDDTFILKRRAQYHIAKVSTNLTILVGIGLADHMLFSRYRFLVRGLVLRAQELLGRQKHITVPYKRPLAALQI